MRSHSHINAEVIIRPGEEIAFNVQIGLICADERRSRQEELKQTCTHPAVV